MFLAPWCSMYVCRSRIQQSKVAGEKRRLGKTKCCLELDVCIVRLLVAPAAKTKYLRAAWCTKRLGRLRCRGAVGDPENSFIRLSNLRTVVRRTSTTLQPEEGLIERSEPPQHPPSITNPTRKTMAASQMRAIRSISRSLRVSRRAFTVSARRYESSVSTSKTETSITETEKELPQSPNRVGVWSRSQKPRVTAMTGPRFEQTDFDLQVRRAELNRQKQPERQR